MKKIQMYINNRYERIDNNEIVADMKGYYIEKWDGVNLWDNNKVKLYLTEEEVKNYLEILDYNNKVNIRNEKRKEAIKHGRVEEVNQIISVNGTPSGIMYKIYYDKEGKRIV